MYVCICRCVYLFAASTTRFLIMSPDRIPPLTSARALPYVLRVSDSASPAITSDSPSRHSQQRRGRKKKEKKKRLCTGAQYQWTVLFKDNLTSGTHCMLRQFDPFRASNPLHSHCSLFPPSLPFASCIPFPAFFLVLLFVLSAAAANSVVFLAFYSLPASRMTGCS